MPGHNTHPRVRPGICFETYSGRVLRRRSARAHRARAPNPGQPKEGEGRPCGPGTGPVQVVEGVAWGNSSAAMAEGVPSTESSCRQRPGSCACPRSTAEGLVGVFRDVIDPAVR